MLRHGHAGCWHVLTQEHFEKIYISNFLIDSSQPEHTHTSPTRPSHAFACALQCSYQQPRLA